MYAMFERKDLQYYLMTPSDLCFVPHLHSHVELVECREGEVRLLLGKESVLLTRGDVAVLFPGVVHGYRTERGSRCRLLLFSPDLAGEYAHLLAGSRPVSPVIRAAEVDADIPHLLGRLQERQPEKRLLRACVQVVLGRALEALEVTESSSAQGADLMDRLLLFMESHFREALTLERVARALGVSRFTISHFFSSRIGFSFTMYLNTLRARCAEQMMLESALPILSVGYEAGFESPSTFYRYFQLCYGQAPGSYRRQHRGATSAARGESDRRITGRPV